MVGIMMHYKREKKIIFRRKAYDKLLEWKTNRQGESAILVEGARRVGKSTLVRTFAQNEYRSFLFIDFSNVSKKVKDLFQEIYDLDHFFFALQMECHVNLYERQSVIVFDEVQKFPVARQAIKHLVADGRYDYIETGSLISIRQNVRNIIIPSEEEKIKLHPLDLEEFRWAVGDEASTDLHRQAYTKHIAVGDGVNRTMMRDFRLYMLIGGMPQAVEAYLKTNNMEAVDRKKREIISLYEEDFRKIDPSGNLSLLFDNIPAMLAKNVSRYTPTTIIGQVSSATRAELLWDLIDSQTVLIAYHATDPNVGMGLSKDLSRYKLYVADIGLAVTLAFKDKGYTENVIYQKLLSNKLQANLGYIYENVVAQMLTAKGDGLFYYTFRDDAIGENSKPYEIDFLLSRGNKIMPVEVKSSSYKRHKSLDVFCEKYAGRITSPTMIYTKDIANDGALRMLPVYYTLFI